eukprot:3281355-Prymnesium_polylepis.1
MCRHSWRCSARALTCVPVAGHPSSSGRPQSAGWLHAPDRMHRGPGATRRPPRPPLTAYECPVCRKLVRLQLRTQRDAVSVVLTPTRTRTD